MRLVAAREQAYRQRSSLSFNREGEGYAPCYESRPGSARREPATAPVPPGGVCFYCRFLARKRGEHPSARLMLRLKRPTLLPGSCQKSLESCTIARYSQKVKQSSGGAVRCSPHGRRGKCASRCSAAPAGSGQRQAAEICLTYFSTSCTFPVKPRRCTWISRNWLNFTPENTKEWDRTARKAIC